MNWLKCIFSRQKASQTQTVHTQIIRLDDETYDSNSEIVEGLKFSATLQIRTPLDILKRHGEYFKGPPSQAPKYGSQADGIWIFKTKTFRELGMPIDEIEHLHASDIGPVKASYYLPFLIKFREIVESDLKYEDKLIDLELLPKQSAQFNEIWRKLCAYYDDFPRSFFYLQLTKLPGIGKKLAKSLYEAGFRTTDDITNASMSRLLAIPGLGKITAQKIKSGKY